MALFVSFPFHVDSRLRLLLVAFLGDEPLRQQRIEDYALIQGYVRHVGGRSDWVCLHAGPASRPNHPYLVELTKDATRLLVDATRAFDPSHILFNERLGAAGLDAVQRAAPEAQVFQPPVPVATSEEVDCSVADFDQRLLDAADTEAVAVATRRVWLLVNWTQCVYGRSVENNPHFRGLAVSDLPFAKGCSFCTHRLPERKAPPLSVQRADLLTQARRYYETIPTDLRSNRFHLYLGPVHRQAHELFAGFHELQAPPTQLFLSLRADELLRIEDALGTWLPQLAAQGHSLHVQQVGLENFSPTENERFNKGIDLKQIEATTVLLRRLEAEHGDAFFFRQLGGYAMILFSPWTTLEDLECNLREITRLDPDGDYAQLLASRLFLIEGTPLEPLARRDGLVLDDTSQAASPFETYCITHWGESELPWRFRRPEVGWIYSTMAELFPEREARRPASDSLLALQRTLRDKGAGRAAILRALVDVARRLPEASVADRVKAVLDWADSLPQLGEDLSVRLAKARRDGILSTALLSKGAIVPGRDGALRTRIESPNGAIVAVAFSRTTSGEGEPVRFFSVFTRSVASTPGIAGPSARRVVRELATLLDTRTQDDDHDHAAMVARARDATRLCETVEAAVQQINEKPKGLLGFRACWPTTRASGEVLLSLVDGRGWLDLVIEERRRNRDYFLSARRLGLRHLERRELAPRAVQAARRLLSWLEATLPGAC